MLQAGWGHHVDRVLLVRAPAELRLERVLRSKGSEEAIIRKLMVIQDDYAQLESGADYLLDNDGSEEELLAKLNELAEIKDCLN